MDWSTDPQQRHTDARRESFDDYPRGAYPFEWCVEDGHRDIATTVLNDEMQKRMLARDTGEIEGCLESAINGPSPVP